MSPERILDAAAELFAEHGVSAVGMVEVARALAQEARVLVMDEPTAALDEAECARLFGIIDQLRARGTAIVYITHRMGEIARLAESGVRIFSPEDGQRLGLVGMINAVVEEIDVPVSSPATGRPSVVKGPSKTQDEWMSAERIAAAPPRWSSRSTSRPRSAW